MLVMVSAQGVAPDLLKPENRTASESRQFTAFGGTKNSRAEVLRRAEDLKRGLLREWQVNDGWQTPVLIVLTAGDGVRLRQPAFMLQVFDAAEAGRKIQIDIAPGKLADSADLDRMILRALLLERSFRGQKFTGNKFVEPPDWMVSALATRLGTNGEGMARLYSSLLEGRGMPKLDRFLGQNAAALNGRAHELHSAQSLALYDSLCEWTGGRKRMMDNLVLAEPARDPLQRFAQTWPELADDPARLARWWALAVARLSSPTKMEFLDAEETGRQLARILEDSLRGTDLADPSESWLQLARTDEGRFRMAQTGSSLQRLFFRAHPLYAPVVAEYQQMAEDLSRKRRRGFAKRFAETEEVRLELDVRSEEITDYMNWFQANQRDEVSWASSLERVMSRNPKNRRNDKISRYLDSVEERGW
jgi:hypothetical protein